MGFKPHMKFYNFFELCVCKQWRRNEFESGGGAPIRCEAPEICVCVVHGGAQHRASPLLRHIRQFTHVSTPCSQHLSTGTQLPRPTRELTCQLVITYFHSLGGDAVALLRVHEFVAMRSLMVTYYFTQLITAVNISVLFCDRPPSAPCSAHLQRITVHLSRVCSHTRITPETKRH